MSRRSVHWSTVLVGLLVGPAIAGAAGPQATGSEAAATRRYVPPRMGAPDNRVSGATRGVGIEPLQLAALAPPDVGLTAREQPRLYWFNSRPIEGDASLTIVDDASNRTVLKATVPGPLPAGINSFPLAGTKGRIGDDAAYQWSLTVVVSKQDPSRNPVASGLIQRIAHSAPDLPATSLWYDEVDTISESIRRAPGDRALRQVRSALLDRAGLTEAAAYDRAASR